ASNRKILKSLPETWQNPNAVFKIYFSNDTQDHATNIDHVDVRLRDEPAKLYYEILHELIEVEYSAYVIKEAPLTGADYQQLINNFYSDTMTFLSLCTHAEYYRLTAEEYFRSVDRKST